MVAQIQILEQMKSNYFILAFGFAIAFSSCTKEEQCDDNCGVIANDGITDDCYWLEIRNDCTNNKKQFCFDQDVWMDNYVGDYFCVTGADPW